MRSVKVPGSLHIIKQLVLLSLKVFARNDSFISELTELPQFVEGILGAWLRLKLRGESSPVRTALKSCRGYNPLSLLPGPLPWTSVRLCCLKQK